MAVAVGDMGDTLVEEIRARVAKLVTGPASDPGSDMGTLITPQARDRVADYVQRGADAGAHRHRWPRPRRRRPPGGNFIGPTVLDHVKPGMDAYATTSAPKPRTRSSSSGLASAITDAPSSLASGIT